MSQPIRLILQSIRRRLRERAGRRAAAIFLTLLVEALVVLLLLTLSPSMSPREEADMALASFDVAAEDAPEPEEAPAPPEPAAPDAEPVERPPEPVEPVEAEPPPAIPPAPPPPPPIIEIPPQQMAAADIAALPGRPAAPARRRMIGPPAPARARSGDTPLVEGTGPNGEPLYAASWYREPYPDELRGYLSTARGPGWGLIACRTVPNYRVEDCVSVGESPEGSGIARSVLAAAWQFRVRPPRLGGRPKVGEWVRIRIDYDLRRE